VPAVSGRFPSFLSLLLSYLSPPGLTCAFHPRYSSRLTSRSDPHPASTQMRPFLFVFGTVTGQWRSHPHGLPFLPDRRTPQIPDVLECPCTLQLLTVGHLSAEAVNHLGQFTHSAAQFELQCTRLHNLNPITPYLDENLTSPSETLPINSMIKSLL